MGLWQKSWIRFTIDVNEKYYHKTGTFMCFIKAVKTHDSGQD